MENLVSANVTKKKEDLSVDEYMFRLWLIVTQQRLIWVSACMLALASSAS